MFAKKNAGGALRILSLEDSISDYELICAQMRSTGYAPQANRVEKGSDFESALRNNTYDVILADFNLPQFDAFGALKIHNEICPDIPFICVSGSIGEETAIELLKSGAVDYVLKDRLERLPFAIRRALDDAKDKEARREAEQELRNSEISFRTLADSGQALIYTMGTDKLCNYFNSVWLKFTGRSLEQELGHGWESGIHKDDYQDSYNAFIEACNRKEKYSVEYRLLRHDGVYRWVLDEGSPRYNGAGEFIGYIGHCLDITDRKKAEEALRESESKYRLIFDNSPVGLLSFDKTGAITACNDNFVTIIGSSREKLIGLNMLSLNDENLIEALKKALSGDTGRCEGVYQAVTSNKSTPARGHFAPVKTENGEIAGGVGIIEDITERKRTEDALKKSEALYRSILNASPDGITITDLNGRILMLSPSVLPIFGYTSENQILGTYIKDFIHPEDWPAIAKRIERMVHGEIPGESSFRALRADGSIFFLEAKGEFIRNDAGQPTQMVIIVRDISERKHHEEALRKSEEATGKIGKHYQSIIEKAPDGIVLLDESGHFKFISPSARKIFGYNATEGIGENPADFTHPDDVTNVIAELMKTFEDPSYVPTMQYRYKFGVNSYKWVESTFSNLLSDPNVESIVINFRDITDRIHAEEELRRSEEKYKTLIEVSQDGVFINQDNKVVYINPAGLKLFGADNPEQVIGKSPFELFHPDFHPLMKQRIESLLKNWINQSTLENQIIRLDGKYVDIEVAATPFILNDKPAIQVVLRDITERNLALEALKLRESYLTAIIENQPGYVWLKDVDGKFLAVNEAFAYANGKRKATELLGKTDFDICDAQLAESYRADDTIVIKDKFPLHFESVFFDGNDEHIIETFKMPVFDNNRLVVGTTGIARDITERKRAKKEIKKLSRAVEQSPASIVITNTSGTIEYANPKTLEISGYKLEEVIGKNPRIFGSGEMSKEDYKILWNTILEGKEWRGELHNKKKNGELIWESVSISPLVNEQNQVTHFIAVKEDVTEKKRMIDELIIAKEKAEEMNKIKSSFFANMSHELRTPLIGVLGFSEILEEELKENPDLSGMANTVKISGQRLMRTLNFILDISKLEAGKIQILARKQNVITLLQLNVDLFAAAVKQKNLEYKFTYDQKEIFCTLDSGLFDNIMNNLINNAVKFTEHGSIQVHVYPNKNHAVIEVVDTGIGISEEKQNIIWEEFRQVSEGISRNYEGTGLGLTIAKKYTELMHGNISVSSVPSVGTTFTVRFPLTDPVYQMQNEDSEHLQDSVTEYETEKKKTILYVEDDDVSTNVIRTFLKDLCDIESVVDGEKAIKAISSMQYDLILMDINLGRGINGIEVTKFVRQLPAYRDIPIIALTAYAMDGDSEEFFEAGCTHYISKPFRKQELVDLVKSALKLS